jgi:hypothetical protein
LSPFLKIFACFVDLSITIPSKRKKKFLIEHPQKKKKNKGAGKPSTYFEGSGKKRLPMWS